MSYGMDPATTIMRTITMDLQYIYATFRSLETVTEKVTFLKELETLNLPYEINYTNLISAWERNGN